MAPHSAALVLALVRAAAAANPILNPSVGLADPHCHVWPDEPEAVYLYATHDCSPSGEAPCGGAAAAEFRMDDWWVWRTEDFIAFEKVATVPAAALAYGGRAGSPGDGAPMPSEPGLGRRYQTNDTVTECWATDAARANGTTYFYLSVGPEQIGVVAGPGAAGPFSDPIGAPLIPEGLVPTKSRDPAIFVDDGVAYLVWGTFDYFVARLDASMVALAEDPRPVVISNQQHSDDKPFLHAYNGTYAAPGGTRRDEDRLR